MLVFPNCKINLGLQILSKREDDYHNLETVFYPVQWTDALEIVPAEKTKFESLGIHIPGDTANNIVLKAYQMLAKDFDLKPLKIILQKHLPVGAGLGGGSANAAFMLKACNIFFELGLNNKDLENYATKLGADCAFFIQNKPTLATGVGDVFENIELDLSAYQIIVIYPKKAINTAWAYAQLKLKTEERASLKNIITQPIETWKDSLVNDFEPEVIKVMPEIKSIKKNLYDSGAIYASMSGSGSSIYGIFKKDIDVENIKTKIEQPGYLIYTGNL